MPVVQECVALALLQAMCWEIDSEFLRVQFEIDAKVVVDAVNSLDEDNSEFGDIICRIRTILHDDKFFYVTAIRRQANGVAHALAQLSRSLSCLATFSSLQSSISRCMNDVCSLGAH